MPHHIPVIWSQNEAENLFNTEGRCIANCSAKTPINEVIPCNAKGRTPILGLLITVSISASNVATAQLLAEPQQGVVKAGNHADGPRSILETIESASAHSTSNQIPYYNSNLGLTSEYPSKCRKEETFFHFISEQNR